MARLGQFSTEKAARDYGVSRQVAANQYRAQEVEAANKLLEETLQKIQNQASKKSKKKGGFLENLVKTVAFNALGPLGAGFQLIDSIASGIKTDKEYKQYIADIKKMAELNPELMKRFKGTPLESILANTIGQSAAEGERYLQGVRGAAKKGAMLDVGLSTLGLGQSFKAAKAAKSAAAAKEASKEAVKNIQIPLTGNQSAPASPMVLSPPSDKSNFLSKLGTTVGDLGGGAIDMLAPGLSKVATKAVTPISTGIRSPKFLQKLAGETISVNPYSLLRGYQPTLLDAMIGEPRDIRFSEIDAPKRRIRV